MIITHAETLAKTSRLVALGRRWSDDLFLNSMQYDSIVYEETKIYYQKSTFSTYHLIKNNNSKKVNENIELTT